MPVRKTCLHASLVLFTCVLLAACRAGPEESTLPSAPTTTSEGQPQHIVDLVDQNLITARITGISMDTLALTIHSMSSQALQVEIPAGTYFVARNELVQNMVARHSTSVLVQPFEERDLTLEAACANVRRAEPGSTDTFGIVRASEQQELGQIIEALNAAAVQYPVEQAAIWIVTDDASYDDLGMLVGGSRYGEALIGENEAVRAMMLVSEAGLDITGHAIWSEVDTLRSNLTDADLTAWLDEQVAAAQAAAGSAAGQPTSVSAGAEVSLWATSAKADYELSPNAASQATGAPDSNGCGQQPTAWATGDANPGATLTLYYDQAVVPTRIVIYETYNPGAVFYVEVRDQFAGGAFQVYEGNAALNPECPHQLVIHVKDVPVGVNVVEISVDQSYDWTEIDAVELTGVTP
jgi:hypothetical protein